jgi:hypothetical protein
MVRPRNGWTREGDSYSIEGGKDYVKDGCYVVSLDTIDRIHEVWKVPAKDLRVEQLENKLQGPLEADKTSPFGRMFLEKNGKNGKPLFQSRLPPRQFSNIEQIGSSTISGKKKGRKEEFERAFKRLAELNAEYTALFIRFLNVENEQLREWVIKNHREVEQLSKIIEAYRKEE